MTIKRNFMRASVFLNSGVGLKKVSDISKRPLTHTNKSSSTYFMTSRFILKTTCSQIGCCFLILKPPVLGPVTDFLFFGRKEKAAKETFLFLSRGFQHFSKGTGPMNPNRAALRCSKKQKAPQRSKLLRWVKRILPWEQWQDTNRRNLFFLYAFSVFKWNS